MKPTFFKSPSEFRGWLEQHHDQAPELWVGFYKKSSGQPSITWPEAVDEALCFGWIDGIRKSVDERRYMIRFTPRKPKSIWSVVNINRVQELTAQGRMQPSGLKAFEERDQSKSGVYSYENDARELDAAYEKKLRANKRAWAFFQSQAASYRRAAQWWVMSAKQEETRLKRLAALIESSEQSLRLAHLTPPSRRPGKSG